MSGPQQGNRKGHGKRKRDGDVEGAPATKRPETNRPEQTTYDEAVSSMNPSLISDHFAKSMKKHSSTSTAIELEDNYIPTRSIRDTTVFTKPHVAKHLSKFLEAFCEGKDTLCKGSVAAPHTLVITSSGIRAADIARELRVYAGNEVKVAKLFAKHMKLAETISFVKKTKINIGVGTPKRPQELIEQGALQLDNLRRIVIDGSYVDEKKRTIFDMADIFLPLIELLNTEKIKSRLGAEENAIEILVF